MMPPIGKRRRSIAEIMMNRERGRPRQQQVELNLPTEVLGSILSVLNLRDNVRASVVSKRWLAAALSVRRANTAPWLMLSTKRGNSYDFYDPASCSTYTLDLPEIQGSRICYATNNWLLLERPSARNFFLFCPYTRETVPLPKLLLSQDTVAFSTAPTSPDCIVFAVSYVAPRFIAICTWRPGATQWVITYHRISSHTRYTLGCWSQVVFSSGRFYCLSLSGQLGVFEVCVRTWFLFNTPPGKLLEEDPSFGKRWRAKFMVEHGGFMYIVCVCGTKNPCIYRVHTVSESWTEVDSLEGVTIFANDLSSQARTDLAGKIAGNVVFSKIHLYKSGCVVYAPREHMYRTKKILYDWHEEDSSGRVWIDAPETKSIFD